MSQQANKPDWMVMWVKAHRDIEGNERADTASKIGTFLPYQEEIITEAGLKMTGKAIRQSERARLNLDFTPVKELDWMGLRYLASVLGGKGLRDWRWRIGKADDWVCRWCGVDRENRSHIGACPVWNKVMGGNVWHNIRKNEYQKKLHNLMEQVSGFT